MWHRRITKGAQHVHERVGVLVGDDIHECLGTARLSLCGEIRELDRRRHPLFGVVHRRHAIQPGIGDL
jgi:hypothetical protein